MGPNEWNNEASYYLLDRQLKEVGSVRGIKWFLSLLAIILIFLAACSPADSIPPGAIVDGLGRPVNIEKLPQRIISLAPSNTEILFALGLGEKVVGVTEFCDYPPEALDKEKIRKYDEIEIVPGISSVQVAASLAQVSLEYTCFITFHKSGAIDKEKKELLEAIQKGKNLILLPRPYDFMPADIADFLVKHGIEPSLRVIIYENLTLKNQRQIGTTLGEIKDEFTDLSIMVIKR